MARGGTVFNVVDLRTGDVLSRHRDRESADRMWAPEIAAGEVRVIDLTERRDGDGDDPLPTDRPPIDP